MVSRLASVCVVLAVVSSVWSSKTCLNSLDVALVIEDSAALPDSASETQLKNFLARIVNHLNLGANDAHVAFQTYNDQSTTQFDLKKYTQTTDAKGAILMTRFLHKNADAPSVGSALNYTHTKILTVENGERSCYPTVVILVSYSSYADPNSIGDGNGKDRDVSVARMLRNSGALILAVGVGANRNPNLLINVAGNTDNYYDLNSFSDLSDSIADDIANRTCNYKPSTDFYPCEMEAIAADLIFVVDVSKKFTDVYAQAVIGFISNYLKPYTFGKDGIQAALVTYSKVADVAISLTAAKSYNQFMQQVNDSLKDGPSGTERYIYNALDTVLFHVLTKSNGFRPEAAHSIFVFTADCFTGPDPVATAQAIRATNTNLYMISLGSPFGFWKETLDISGDPQNLFEVPIAPEVILPNFLPKVAWRALCSGNTQPKTTTAAPATTAAAETTSRGRTTTEPPTTTGFAKSTTPRTTLSTTRSTPTTSTSTTTPSTSTSTTTPSTSTSTTTPTRSTSTTTPTRSTSTTTPTRSTSTTTPTPVTSTSTSTKTTTTPRTTTAPFTTAKATTAAGTTASASS